MSLSKVNKIKYSKHFCFHQSPIVLELLYRTLFKASFVEELQSLLEQRETELVQENTTIEDDKILDMKQSSIDKGKQPINMPIRSRTKPTNKLRLNVWMEKKNI